MRENKIAAEYHMALKMHHVGETSGICEVKYYAIPPGGGTNIFLLTIGDSSLGEHRSSQTYSIFTVTTKARRSRRNPLT